MVSTLNTEYKGQGEARALSLLAPVVSLASEKNAWHYLVSKWMNTWTSIICLREKKIPWQTEITRRLG